MAEAVIYSAQPDPAGDAGESSGILAFERYWRQAINSRVWIAAILGAGIVLGLLVTLLSTPLYQSTAVIEISRVTSNVTNIEESEIEELQADEQYFQTQYELLGSRFLAEAVVAAGNLTA